MKNEIAMVPELWGGAECSIVRINDSYYNQVKESGCYSGADWAEEVASLGIRKLRYPLLWESISPVLGKFKHIRQHKLSLEKLLSCGVEPVAGLLHHGSGPLHTNLLDEEFPLLFSRYALAIAQKFPQIKYYTPINEPLTTARFSGLYGHWYPHKKDNYSFCIALLNQCKAVIMAMKNIRSVNPGAVLVQTEDIGKTASTKKLSYQAEFENNRRWFTYDLLCGRLSKGDYLWNFFTYSGVRERDLVFFLENSCPPGIMGINYYVTSERYLDHNTAMYPEAVHGGNGRDVYADIETVRSIKTPAGIETIIREAYERYGIRIAVTEAHLACSKEEQMRWFSEIWNTCTKLLGQGIPAEAVTAWALYGAFDWCSLMTKKRRIYEPGVFDISGGSKRVTALGSMLEQLSGTGSFSHPLLETPGWWKRPARTIYGKQNMELQNNNSAAAVPVLIIGAGGTLGRAFAEICSIRGISAVKSYRRDLDITNPDDVKYTIEKYKPWAVINAAGYVDVDRAENNKAMCYLSNTIGAEIISNICNDRGIKLVTFSSDLVFNGDKTEPYLETDSVCPLNIYGMTKAAAEKKITAKNPDALVIRSSAFFGPWDTYNFIYKLIRCCMEKIPMNVPSDIFISPTYVPELVNKSLDLMIDNESGIRHISNKGVLSWAEFGQMAAEIFNLDSSLLRPVACEEISYKARRPLYSALGSRNGAQLQDVANALEQYKNESQKLFV